MAPRSELPAVTEISAAAVGGGTAWTRPSRTKVVLARRDLVIWAYKAIRLLRLLMANHRALTEYDGVPDWLDEGKIYDC